MALWDRVGLLFCPEWQEMFVFSPTPLPREGREPRVRSGPQPLWLGIRSTWSQWVFMAPGKERLHEMRWFRFSALQTIFLIHVRGWNRSCQGLGFGNRNRETCAICRRQWLIRWPAAFKWSCNPDLRVPTKGEDWEGMSVHVMSWNFFGRKWNQDHMFPHWPAKLPFGSLALES